MSIPSMRKNIIALSLFEAAKKLCEQTEAAAAAAPPPAEPPPPADTAEGSPVPTDEETGKAITLDQLLSRLNIIRSGKSFQDPETYGKLTTMFKNMSPEDKLKLNQQLKNIGAIVQDQIPQQQQPAGMPPSAAPAAVAPPPPAPPPAAAPAV